MSRSPMWNRVIGQPDVVTSLTSAISLGKLSHAYLFLGPAGLGKTAAAWAIAASLMCEKGGCGQCNVCQRIMRGTHPDVQTFEPEGSAGYLTEQIRALTHETSLAPFEGKHKVYIVYSADMLGDAAANAFLKTLEEPPAHTTFILLAHTLEPILPTILSRCITMRFRTLPSEEMIDILCANTGCNVQDAQIALTATANTLGDAAEFVVSATRRQARETLVNRFVSLPQADDYEVLQSAKDIMVGIKGPVEELRQKQESDLLSQAELLDKVAIKTLEGYNKRRLNAFEKRNVDEICTVVQSLLRDVLVVSQGASDMIRNIDVRPEMLSLGCAVAPLSISRGVDAVCAARKRLSHNVGSQLVIETLLFDIREVLECPK